MSYVLLQVLKSTPQRPISVSHTPSHPSRNPSHSDQICKVPFQKSISVIAVESLSLFDHQKSVDIDQVRLNKIQTIKAAYISKIERLDDQVLDNRKRDLARVVEQEFSNRFKLAMATRREIGSAFATSGYRLSSKNCRLDWGLVELHEDRIEYNKVRNLYFFPYVFLL